jgi:hypothetical protein
MLLDYANIFFRQTICLSDGMKQENAIVCLNAQTEKKQI